MYPPSAQDDGKRRLRANWRREDLEIAMAFPGKLATALPNLWLTALRPEDATAYYALVDRNRDHLTQHGDYLDLGEATPESVLEDLRHPQPGAMCCGIWFDDHVIGRADLTPRTTVDVVLGYWLGREFTGHGYATLAGAALIAYGASVLGAQTVWAGVTKGNSKSEAVLARLGFHAVSDQGTYTRFCRRLT
ncbi:MAG: GNAT family N-acetyltransferase [Thermomicrobiales bacterium]